MVLVPVQHLTHHLFYIVLGLWLLNCSLSASSFFLLHETVNTDMILYLCEYTRIDVGVSSGILSVCDRAYQLPSQQL